MSSTPNSSPAVQVQGLCKLFQIPIPGSGIMGSIFGSRKEVSAVHGLDFSIAQGERVAFIGPNGAGKSTTIKMLCGILEPSAGTMQVLGAVPHKEREKLSRKIGIVFGQRSQLWNFLPVRDSFELLLAIYDVPAEEGKLRIEELSELLGIQALLASPSGKLSLGERMRCELVGALLHQPQLLFLDEPTIGLDVQARTLLRSYIRKISEREGVTVLLTSHDTADIAEVCDRCLLINHGRLLLDKSMHDLHKIFLQKKRVSVVFGESIAEKVYDVSQEGVRVLAREDFHLYLEVETQKYPIDSLMRTLMGLGYIQDLSIEDPPLEDIIMQLYRQGVADASA